MFRILSLSIPAVKMCSVKMLLHTKPPVAESYYGKVLS